MTQTVAVIDYGSGNLHSVAKAVEHAGQCRVLVTADPKEIQLADRVVLPGVGAMGDCMQGLKERGLDLVVLGVIQEKPLMGVCVGMQILTESGEESAGVDALGVFSGQITQFSKSMKNLKGDALKVPHMGWNEVEQRQHPMWNGIADRTRFYFVHSYWVDTNDSRLEKFQTDYGLTFTSGIVSSHCLATQFHPEKSQARGIQLYRNFLENID